MLQLGRGHGEPKVAVVLVVTERARLFAQTWPLSSSGTVSCTSTRLHIGHGGAGTTRKRSVSGGESTQPSIIYVIGAALVQERKRAALFDCFDV